MTPGGRPVASGAATLTLDSSPHSNSMRGSNYCLHLFAKLLSILLNPVLFNSLLDRRVALQQPRALFKPRRIKPPGDNRGFVHNVTAQRRKTFQHVAITYWNSFSGEQRGEVSPLSHGCLLVVLTAFVFSTCTIDEIKGTVSINYSKLLYKYYTVKQM